MVSIVAFQAVDPGSIPGHRTFYSITFIQESFYLVRGSCNLCRKTEKVSHSLNPNMHIDLHRLPY